MTKLTKDELINKYKDVKVPDLIKQIREAQNQSFECMRVMVEKLTHLELSQRWREEAPYRKSSFEDFISNAFPPMTDDKYRQYKNIYLNYEDEARKLSPEVVARAVRFCAPEKLKTVLNTMMQREEKTGKQIPLCTKYQIIRENSRPKPPAQPTAEPPKPELYKTIDELRVQRVNDAKQLEIKDEQINKLKERVFELEAENATLREELERYRELEQGLINMTRKYMPEVAAMA